MGNKKKKGGTGCASKTEASSKSSVTATGSQPLPSPTDVLGANDPLFAVIEFHHMLIGNTHKKEAAAISAAASHAIVGFIFMGGPSFAVVEGLALDDVRAWLADCKKAGKEGSCKYWTPKEPKNAPRLNNKLKVMGYAPGKDTRVDMQAFQESLADIGIAFPLPTSAPLL